MADDDVCPSCGSTHLYFDDLRAELRCSNCEAVISSNAPSFEPEFDHGGGAEPREADQPFTSATRRPMGSRDSQGKPGDPKIRSALSLGTRLDRRHRKAAERRMERVRAIAFAEIGRVGLTHEIVPRVLFLLNSGMTMIGHQEDLRVAKALILIACRERGIGLTLRDLEPDRRELGRILRLEAILQRGLKISTRTPNAVELVPVLSGKLDLPPALVEEAKRVARDLTEAAPNSVPKTVAAAALFTVAGRNGRSPGQARFAEACGVSEIALRTALKRVGLPTVYPQPAVPDSS